MPWSISASRQSSLRLKGSVAPAISSSVGGLGVHDRVKGALRLASASPLTGKGRPRLSRALSIESYMQPGLGSIGESQDGLEEIDAALGLGMDDDEPFELHQLPADAGNQEISSSQWVASALEYEAYNFLAFLDAQIVEKQNAATQPATSDEASITMDELLPPIENSNVVAAQALLHILTLATKGLITIRQSEPFGDIDLSIDEGAEEE